MEIGEVDETILTSASPVTLLGAGACRQQDLTAALDRAPVLVAVDGGAATALACGAVPTAVVGDFDSLDPKLRRQLPAGRVHHMAEQETTDFDKALRAVRAPLLIGVGFLGDRLDHELAAMNVLVRSATRCLLIGPHEVVFAAPPELRLDLAAGARVSLFPMAAVTGRSEGLHWPIEGIGFAPGGRTGTSNFATGRVHLSFDGPGMLVLLQRSQLDVAIAALRR